MDDHSCLLGQGEKTACASRQCRSARRPSRVGNWPTHLTIPCTAPAGDVIRSAHLVGVLEEDAADLVDGQRVTLHRVARTGYYQLRRYPVDVGAFVSHDAVRLSFGWQVALHRDD